MTEMDTEQDDLLPGPSELPRPRAPETEFSIDNQRYHLLGKQRGGAAVYRGDAGAYLRLGEREVIERDLGLHRAMERAKFPVAPLISDGELGNERYFVEQSLGQRSFRAIFQETTDASRVILKSNFDAFIGVMKKLHAAQFKANQGAWNSEEFAEGIKLPLLCKELPDHADALLKRFGEAHARLRLLPGTLTHGDCNPSNVYENGIIDLEDSFHGPLGYDQISALISIEWSPDTRDYEFVAQYRFTKVEQQHYLHMFDVLHAKYTLPPLSKFLDDLSFCRAVWLCTGMGAWPRIQQWRYEKLINTYLS